ncbi:MAG: GNAT family N-acetyltransferase [Cellulosilyticum sp.]|nr:GNAT family N-acetyltransferase [Cellulosilyticum sp.]
MGRQFTKHFTTFPTYEGEKINLRQLRLSDGKDLLTYYNNPMVYRYLDWYGPQDMEMAERVLKHWIEGYEKGYILRFAITEKETDQIIGTIFLTDVTETKGEIGYELSQSYWHQGIMTEALKEVIRIGFEEMGLVRLQAIVCEDNKASQKLLEKVGFIKEGLLRSYECHMVTGECKDMVMNSLINAGK